MFGYIYVNRKELSEEDRKDYQSYYCGLCQALRKSSGDVYKRQDLGVVSWARENRNI